MRRTILLLAAMALTLLVASGVALAVTKIGTNGPDTLRGTNGDDNLLGKGANDVLYALGGRDNLLGAEGKDWLFGGNERRAQGGDKNLVGSPVWQYSTASYYISTTTGLNYTRHRNVARVL